MANFRPKQPILRAKNEYYEDTLENFLRYRPLKKRSRLDHEPLNGGTNGKTAKLLKMQRKSADHRGK
jgi:hypothetical protein